MKKLLSSILVGALLICSVFAFASCLGGKTLSGKYKCDGFLSDTVYEFDGNDVEISYKTGLGSYTVEGTYEIVEKEDGKSVIIITIGDEVEGSGEYSGEHRFDEGEENGTKYIKIDGVQYFKVK